MNSDNANQETVQVAAGLMQEAELSYSHVVAENEQLKAQLATAEAQYNQLAADYDAAKKRCKKLNSDNAELKDKFEQEVRSKTELFMRYQEESNQILLREKELAVKEAEFYKLQLTSASNPRTSVTPIRSEQMGLPIQPMNSRDPLQAYDFTVKHVNGLDNGLTDALRRDFADNNTDYCKLHVPITCSSGPATKTRR
ncbi:hypothetical protein BB560_004864, partial [Smittium megazygosporum]